MLNHLQISPAITFNSLSNPTNTVAIESIIRLKFEKVLECDISQELRVLICRFYTSLIEG